MATGPEPTLISDKMVDAAVESIRNSDAPGISAAVRDALTAALAQSDLAQLRYERQLLGAARRLLDQLDDQPLSAPMRKAAADLAQRIVDEIGHSVTDEPALGPSYRDKLARIRAILDE